MIVYYDNHLDCYYAVPHRCGSSFTYDISQAAPDRLRHHPDTYNYFTMAMMQLPKNSKVYIIYRDPVARYASALEMVLSVRSGHKCEAALKDFIRNPDTVTDNIQKIIDLVEMDLITDFTMNDAHCLPAMAQCLFTQCAMSDDVEIQWVNLRNYTEFMKLRFLGHNDAVREQVFQVSGPVKSVRVAHSWHNGPVTINGSMDPNEASIPASILMEMLYKHTDLFTCRSLLTFDDWISSDVKCYDFIEKNPNFDKQDAVKFLSDVISADPYFLLRGNRYDFLHPEVLSSLDPSLQQSMKLAIDSLPNTLLNISGFSQLLVKLHDANLGS